MLLWELCCEDSQGGQAAFRLGMDPIQRRQSRIPRRWAGGVAVAVVVVASFAAGFTAHWTREPQARAESTLPLVWETWGYVEQYFYGDIPGDADLVHGAIDGALETLEDPFTRLVRPADSSLDQDRLRGAYGGIGAEVYEEDGKLCLRPLPNTPASEAGILEGDQLVAVDGVPLPEDATVDLAVSLVRGAVGSRVTVTVFRPATGAKLDYTMVRVEVPQPSVDYRLLEDTHPAVGYVSITVFGEKTATELQRALAALQQQGAERLVLDLRGNPGGLLDAAVEVSSRFLRQGVVAFEVGKEGTEHEYRVLPRLVADEPMVVLVDGNTASAAEIVAGALQDHGRALLVGQATRGKGSVQLAYELSDGSSLHVTTSLWLTPSHRQINGVGLEPDITVDSASAEGDPVLDEGIRALEAGARPSEVDE